MLASAKRVVPYILVGLLVVLSLSLSAEEDESYSVQLDGRKTWTLRYGIGDAMGLATSGFAAGQLMLDQTLSVDIRGEALSILAVEAHYDDRQPDSLQSLAITLDTERLDGVLGDFVATGIGGLAAYNKKMMGLRLEYTLGNAVLTGVASKLEGVSESRVYVGEKAHEVVTYSTYSMADPPKLRPYKRRIDGLYAYPLDVFYVKEFSEVHLPFDVSETLRSTLSQYGLDYLSGVLVTDGDFELEEQEYLVVGEEDQTLLLREDAVDLVRDRLEVAIDLYNEANNLSGEDAKEYPFSRGTAYELAFLEAVAASVLVSVDSERHPILEGVRERFYDLGRKGIVPGSVSTELSPDGVAFDPITSPEYSDYSVKILSDVGILEIDFPGEFFTDASAIRVNFDYTVTGGVFMLGVSIIPESDRVTVNDVSLVRDVDYMIDYEIGMLVLLVEIAETDVIRVDFERFSGGIFGGGSDYATYFYGLALDWPISEHLAIQASVLRSAEDLGSVTDPEGVSTMPNQHTVAGISGTVTYDDFGADFLVGYSHDEFPFDDNARANRANEVAAIVAAGEYVFFGHRAGLTVRRGDEWITYGTIHGLTGRSVQAMETGGEALFVGTNSGLTVISLVGLSPLDRIGNWTSYYQSDQGGLPSGSVSALLLEDGVLWIGTDAGLTAVPIEEIDDVAAWARFDDEIELGAVGALASDGETLYVGTEDGTYQYSLATEQWSRLPGSAGAQVNDLLLMDGTLYVGSDRGLRSYRGGIGTGWLVMGEAVYSVGAIDGRLVYGGEAGLIDAEDHEVLLGDAPVTALEMEEDVVWVGTRADANYDLMIWAVGETVDEYGPSATGIVGRDPFGFIDTAAEEHTLAGFIERASFRHAADGFTLSGGFENLSPSYRPIGSRGRSDSTGWDLAAAWELGDQADLSVSHAYDITGRLSGEPRSTMVNDLSLQWTFGPVLTLSARQQSANDEATHEGPESSSYSYQFSLRDQFFAERLDAGISWSDGYAWSYEAGEPRRTTRLSFDADVTISTSWAAHLDWARPIRTSEGEWNGSERLTLQTDWSRSGTVANFGVDYTFGWQRSVPGGIGSREHEVELNADVVPFSAAGWQVTPGATLGVWSDESSVDIDGRLTVRGGRGDLSIQGTLRGGLSGLGERVLRENEKLTLTVSFAGIEGLRPSMTYSVDRQVAIYDVQRRQTIAHSLTGRLTWASQEIHYDELSFSLSAKGAAEDRQVTAKVENSYRLDLEAWAGSWWRDEEGGSGYPRLDVRVDTDLSYRLVRENVDFDATTSARLNAAFSPAWSGTFGVSYMGGTDSAGTAYHSLLLELTVAIDF